MQVWEHSDDFLENRVNELEKEYESTRDHLENQQRIDELNFQISGLLGKNNLHILREYTDRLIARFNTDAVYFYRMGREDAEKINLT